MEYSNDIKSQKIIYESDDYVVCEMFPEHLNVYHLTDYRDPFAHKDKRGWISCGSWYLKEDGTYFDSANYYNRGLGSANSPEEIVEALRNSRFSSPSREPKKKLSRK